jgi:hypothetical protein
LQSCSLRIPRRLSPQVRTVCAVLGKSTRLSYEVPIR